MKIYLIVPGMVTVFLAGCTEKKDSFSSQPQGSSQTPVIASSVDPNKANPVQTIEDYDSLMSDGSNVYQFRDHSGKYIPSDYSPMSVLSTVTLIMYRAGDFELTISTKTRHSPRGEAPFTSDTY